MGLDPTMLLGLMGNMGNSMQGAANTALSAVPTGISLLDRMRLRSNPILNMINLRDLGQAYRSISQNPYGDPWGGWGGSFGTDQSGNPVGFGEANVRAIMDMMGNTPAESTVRNLQSLSGMQGPGYANVTSPMNSLLGLPSNPSPGAVPGFTPRSTFDKGNGGRGGRGGRGNKPQTGGKGGSTTPKPPRTAAGPQSPLSSMAGGLPAINVNIGSGGGGGGFMSGPLARLAGNAFAARGGMPALMSQVRGPGNFLNDVGDFWRQGARPPGPDPNAAFWATHGNPGGKGVPPMPSQYDWLQNAQPPKGMPSYAVGTSYVPKTGPALLHQGEAVIPRRLNPMAQSGAMTGGYNPMQGVPAGGQSFGAKRPGGVQSGGMQGGSVAPAPQAPHSLLQDVIANPMSLTPQIQQQIINRGTDSLTNNYGQMARGAWDRSAALGGAGASPNMAALNFGLAGDVSDLNRDVRIESARTNFGDLMGAAGLQWGATRDAANMDLANRQFNQGVFNDQWARQHQTTQDIYGAQQDDINRQLQLWQMINGLGNTGINFPNSFMDRLRGGVMNQLVPNSIAMPTGGGQVGNPFTLGTASQLTSWGS